MMNYDEIVEVARRRGRIQWAKSGIVERVHLSDYAATHGRTVVVAAIGNGRRRHLHGLLPPKCEPPNPYHCVEVGSDTPLTPVDTKAEQRIAEKKQRKQARVEAHLAAKEADKAAKKAKKKKS